MRAGLLPARLLLLGDEHRLAGLRCAEEVALLRRVLDRRAGCARADEHVAAGELVEGGLPQGLLVLALLHDE